MDHQVPRCPGGTGSHPRVPRSGAAGIRTIRTADRGRQPRAQRDHWHVAGLNVPGLDRAQPLPRGHRPTGTDALIFTQHRGRPDAPPGGQRRLGGGDVAVALAASPASFDQAYRSLRRGGRLVCVALPGDNATMQLPIFDTVLNGKTVIGSIVGTRNDLADVFALHAAGRTTVISVDRKLDDVNEAMTEVLTGKVPARIVFQF